MALEEYVFGIRPLLEKIQAGANPDKVLIQKGLQGDNFQELFALIRQRKIPFQMVPQEKLHHITKKNHQGVLAYMPLIAYQPLDEVLTRVIENGETPLILMADGITDVRNLGAMARTASCAGVHALVVPAKGGAPITSDSMKTSAGALASMPVCRESTLLEALAFCKACGLSVTVMDEKGKNSVFDSDLKGPMVVVMGAEDKGVSSAVRKMADRICSIPMVGSIASLNVSVATGVVLFEALRQRQTRP